VLIIALRIEDVDLPPKMELLLGPNQWYDALSSPRSKALAKLSAAVRDHLSAQPIPEELPAARRGSNSRRPFLVVAGAACLLLVIGVLWWGLGRSASHNKEMSGVRPIRAGQLPSELRLRGGDFMIRSGGTSAGYDSLSVAGIRTGHDFLRNRVVTVSNAAAAVTLPAQFDCNHLVFEVTNQSNVAVTLTGLQVVLVGIVNVYDDSIPDPVAPVVADSIPDLQVQQGESPRFGYTDLRRVFHDDDTPAEDLKFSIEANSNPNLVTARLDERGLLDLEFSPALTGDAKIAVKATDPFDLFSQTEFGVTVYGEGQVALRHLSYRTKPIALRLKTSRAASEIRAGMVSDEVVDLGTVVFAYEIGRNELVACAESGDLLNSGEAHVVGPAASQPFMVRILCRTTLKDNHADAPPDTLAGFDNPRRRLLVRRPELTATYHILAIKAHAISESGTGGELFVDQFYLLESSRANPSRAEGIASGALELSPQFLDEQTPRACVAALLEGAVRLHRETKTYRKAAVCRAVPEDLDSLSVSPRCYFGDTESPFRSDTRRGRFDSGLSQNRSNFVDVLAATKRMEPVLYSVFQVEIEKFTHGGDGPSTAEAGFVQRQLASESARPVIVRSTSRVAAGGTR
jgi:hypothetical protein